MLFKIDSDVSINDTVNEFMCQSEWASLRHETPPEELINCHKVILLSHATAVSDAEKLLLTKDSIGPLICAVVNMRQQVPNDQNMEALHQILSQLFEECDWLPDTKANIDNAIKAIDALKFKQEP